MLKKLLFPWISVFAMAAFLFAGCATTKTSGVITPEGDIEKRERTVDKAGDSGNRNNDASISTAIKTKFASDQLISDSNINVDTRHAHVTLNGRVGSQAEVTRAVKIGRSIKGVKSVHSNLIVGSDSKESPKADQF